MSGGQRSDDRREFVRRRGNRRLVIVLAAAVFLAGQGAYAFLARDEPFPAVIMPGFGSSSDIDGTYRTTFLEVRVGYADGSEREVPFDQIMGDFRFSAMKPSIAFLFDPQRHAADPSPAVREWLRERAHEIDGVSEPTSVTFTWVPSIVRLSDASVTAQGPTRSTVVNL